MSLTSYLAAPSRDFIQATLSGCGENIPLHPRDVKTFLKKNHDFFYFFLILARKPSAVPNREQTGSRKTT